MQPQTIAIYVGSLILLIMMSAFFSATETAFTSLNKIKIKNMADAGDDRAVRVLKLSESFDKLLSTILIGNNIVNIAATAVATVFFVRLFGSYGPTVATVTMTIFVLIFGEISPKNLAKENPESFALFSAPIISILMVVLAPLNHLFSKWKELLFRVFKSKGEKGITEDELKTMVEEAETAGSLHSDQSELIQNAIEFNDLEAQDVLTPRVEIEAIDVTMKDEEIAEKFLATGFSRLPVYEEDLDKILGVLNEKDFHRYIYKKDGDLKDHIKPVLFVAETMSAAVLLKRMQNAKCQIAIVVDEYGGTTGLIAMEDILEELVGEIYDEHETGDSEEIYSLGSGEFVVQGSANAEKMFDYFDDEDEESEAITVSGWVTRLIDKFPEVGDTFSYDSSKKSYRGRVTSSDGKKALEVRIKVTDLEESGNEPADDGKRPEDDQRDVRKITGDL